jgi:outer membrane protein insertion porin family
MTRLIIKFYFIVSFIAVLSYSASAQTITEFDIEGNSNFSESEYIDWSGIAINSSYFDGILDSVKQRISEQLTQQGYFNFEFTSSNVAFSDDSQSVNLKLEIEEGTPTYLNRIITNEISSADSAILNKSFEYLIGSIFFQSEFETAVNELLTYYEENAFPFYAIKIQSVYFSRDSVEEKYLADVFLNIKKGDPSTITKVEIIGNDKTKDYVILRSINLNENEKYSQTRIEDIPKSLNRLRFFEPVSIPTFYLNSKNEGVLQIKVKEKQTNNFDGIIGYVPDTREGETGYFTGFVNISLRNILGTGRAAAIKWQQQERNTQEIELKYLEPWIFGFPFNIGTAFFQRKQDTSYVQRKFDGTLDYIATEDITASLLISTETTIPTESDFSQFTVFNSNSFTTGLSLLINTSDDFYAPTSGMIFRNTYKFSRKKINGPEDYITSTTETKINLQRIEVDFSYFFEFFTRQIAALSLHGREMRGSSFDQSDLYRLGGTYSLRGYRENQFIANRIFWSNLEYRYLLTKRTFAYLFFDTGYYLRNEEPERNIERNEGFKIGYGLGLNLETGIGVLGVNFGIAKGDSFSDGKIHFGILNEF